LNIVNVIGQNYETTIEENLDPNVYSLLSSEELCSGEIKIYAHDHSVGARLAMRSVVKTNSIEFHSNRVIEHRDDIDLDRGLIEKLKSEKNIVKLQIECNIENSG
jgi:hypothetical protein